MSTYPQTTWPQVHPQTGELEDITGCPWIEAAHSANKTCTENGTWRRKRGVDPRTVAVLEGEARCAAIERSRYLAVGTRIRSKTPVQDEGPRVGLAGTEGKIEAVFSEQDEDTIHVLVADRDDPDGVDNRSIVFEQYVDRSSLEEVRAFQAKLGNRFGRTRIAKLVFVD